MHQLPGHQLGPRITGQAHLDQPDLDLDTHTLIPSHTKLIPPPGDPLKPPHWVRCYMPDPPVASNALRLACGRELDYNEARTFQLPP